MFNYIGRVGSNVPPFENKFLLTNAEGSTLGEALTLNGATGRLTKTGATATPDYIAIRTQTAEATSVTPLPVIQVQETLEFETTSTGQIPVTAIGSKYTIHTDGLQITTTTTAGVFQVTATDGATLSRVRGFFRR